MIVFYEYYIFNKTLRGFKDFDEKYNTVLMFSLIKQQFTNSYVIDENFGL